MSPNIVSRVRHVLDQLVTLIGAGHDTSAYFLCYALLGWLANTLTSRKGPGSSSVLFADEGRLVPESRASSTSAVVPSWPMAARRRHRASRPSSPGFRPFVERRSRSASAVSLVLLAAGRLPERSTNWGADAAPFSPHTDHAIDQGRRVPHVAGAPGGNSIGWEASSSRYACCLALLEKAKSSCASCGGLCSETGPVVRLSRGRRHQGQRVPHVAHPQRRHLATRVW